MRGVKGAEDDDFDVNPVIKRCAIGWSPYDIDQHIIDGLSNRNALRAKHCELVLQGKKRLLPKHTDPITAKYYPMVNTCPTYVK